MRELQEAAMKVNAKSRNHERLHFREGAAFTTWEHAGYWFAQIDGDVGCGVAEDEEGAVAFAEAEIERRCDESD